MVRFEYHGFRGHGSCPGEVDLFACAADVGLNLVSLAYGPWDDGRYRASFEWRNEADDLVYATLVVRAVGTDEIMDWLAAYGRGEVWG